MGRHSSMELKARIVETIRYMSRDELEQALYTLQNIEVEM